MSIDPSDVPHVATPATKSFLSLLAAGSQGDALRVLDQNWLEVWFAIDSTDLKEVMLALPAEAFADFTNASLVNQLIGREVAAVTVAEVADDPRARVEWATQRVGDLRLEGRPRAALEVIEAVGDDARRLRGPLVDSTAGAFPVWLVQAGITALLAEDPDLARACFHEAAADRRPTRFPFVERDGVAKLGLLHAVVGEPREAEACLARAERISRTGSWVEQLIDDTLWLTRYICAIDALDLEEAERMRQERPSPFAHLEFWGVALQAQVRHFCLTGRRDRARQLCDEVAAMGLPMPGSDGWVAKVLNDARLMCLSLAESRSGDGPNSAAEVLLARRTHLLATGRYRELSVREPEPFHRIIDARTRIALELCRGQGLLHGGRPDDGRRVLLDALRDAFVRGTSAVLRFLTAETLDLIADTELGERARRLVSEKQVCLVEVVAALESPLTAAETRVLRRLTAGLSRQQIAEESYVSIDTVKSQLASAYRKLRARNRADAVAKFERLGG